MKNNFVSINNRLLDYQDYRKEVSSLRIELAFEISELLGKYGFSKVNDSKASFDFLTIHSKNEDLAVEIFIVMKGTK